MRVLIVKTSSLGDLLHAMPALSDAAAALPEASFDWAVEEEYAEVPYWHPRVRRVIPVATRRWRKSLYRPQRVRKEWRLFKAALRETAYDRVIDAQGLLKSAFIASRARGLRYGMDRRSARERIAARFCHYPLFIDRERHAIDRLRILFSLALDYPLPDAPAEYGIIVNDSGDGGDGPPYLLFIHGTAQRRKEWPRKRWRELCALATAAGYQVRLPGHSARERQRAQELAREVPGVTALPPLNLSALAGVMRGARAVVTLDTGPGHLAAALGQSVVALYGPTSAQHTGTRGAGPQRHLHPEPPERRLADISAERVWEAVQAQLAAS